ncbi:hypothetical protein V499_09262 [Pseudogymnoascus sp. VKM F-103]|uniref:Uncharacterized protein n=1 Tax=Pseudogymnoascus verrucosus TaxID=342668 RepID=A0A1B8G9R7_9PEZI|nr:uncharacterized protein VE01_09625 [Pseudogymnoascus verrucosus]KFY70326.1 hypothetical protein V499_09262 [Pseudogymnoascus sp. VKM F-103]OBT92579.1 hypothetical protein VE01_09625 [Pseudogymnoascus verrucosus]
MATYENTQQQQVAQPQYAPAPQQQVVQQPYASQPAPVAGPPAGNDDVAHWTNRITAALNKPETITGPVPASHQPWHNRFLEFFQPIDLCLITCCCPCVTFGKTHHRLHHDANLKDYSPVNASCLGWWASGCCAATAVGIVLQRRTIMDRFGLTGDFPVNCLRGCFCGCCDLIQQEKEVEYRLLQQGGVTEQPTANHEMKVPGGQQY